MIFFSNRDKKILECQERLETLERQFKRLSLEWEDTFDKLKSFYQRIAKRAERLERDTAGNAEEVTDVAPASSAGLTGRQLQAQQQILERRARLSKSEVKQ
jgi:uncharacterized protein (UPF0335 family)